MKTDTIFYGLIFFLLFFTNPNRNLSGQSNVTLDGIWCNIYNDYEEHLGHFELKATIKIIGENYSWEEERVSEFAMFWEWGERGNIIIMENEIQLFPKEEKGQLHDWRKIETNKIKNEQYRFSLSGKYLTLIIEGKEVTYEKME